MFADSCGLLFENAGGLSAYLYIDEELIADSTKLAEA
jgi:hypothetical protein